MKSPHLLLATSLALLTGCASDQHYAAQREQLAAWERVEIARAQAGARKYEALTAAARDGSDLARVAVAFAVQANGNGGDSRPNPLPVITDPAEGAYRWASLILPTATAITAGYFGYKLGTVQSDNARMQTEASYQAVGAGYASNTAIAGAGFRAVAAIPASNTTTTTNTYTTSGVTAFGGPASLDQSRRCSGSWNIIPASNSAGSLFTAPFNC